MYRRFCPTVYSGVEIGTGTAWCGTAEVEPGFDSARRASNQWAISPERTASGNAMLLVDPHLAWWGVSRFWEVRVHAGELAGSGVTLAGSPYIGLGHNRDVAWAMTTGGPDTADVYRLELHPEDPQRYRYDGDWREMETREVTLAVRDAEPETHTLRFSHHGPIIASRPDENRAWAARVAYDVDAKRNEAWFELNFATDYKGAVRAGDTLGMFPQNMMVADTSGNIYYQRVGRVPKRPEGHDYSKPLDGSTPETEWQGLHPAEDHVQILNPPQGYMQNCNIPPDAMMVDSPLQPGDYPDYLFASAHYGPDRSGWTNQRGARALELLAGDSDVTVEEATAWALDVKPYGTERWLTALDEATEGRTLAPAAADIAELLQRWEGRLTADSRSAQLYAQWRRTLKNAMGAEAFRALRDDLEPWYAETATSGEVPERDPLTEAQKTALANALHEVAGEGVEGPTWGDVHRVGRDDASWPVGGGGDDSLGLTTLRTVGYGEPRADGTRRGRHGQTSTQLIVLSDPIRSWIYLPVGQSDRPDSPHYDDQAEHLFSPRRIKPSRWQPEALAGHVASRTVLGGAPSGEP